MKTRLGRRRFQHADRGVSRRFSAETRTLEAMRTQAFSNGLMSLFTHPTPHFSYLILKIYVETVAIPRAGFPFHVFSLSETNSASISKNLLLQIRRSMIVFDASYARARDKIKR
jgi:hypothetical protein